VDDWPADTWGSTPVRFFFAITDLPATASPRRHWARGPGRRSRSCRLAADEQHQAPGNDSPPPDWAHFVDGDQLGCCTSTEGVRRLCAMNRFRPSGSAATQPGKQLSAGKRPVPSASPLVKEAHSSRRPSQAQRNAGLNASKPAVRELRAAAEGRRSRGLRAICCSSGFTRSPSLTIIRGHGKPHPGRCSATHPAYLQNPSRAPRPRAVTQRAAVGRGAGISVCSRGVRGGF